MQKNKKVIHLLSDQLMTMCGHMPIWFALDNLPGGPADHLVTAKPEVATCDECVEEHKKYCEWIKL